MELQLVVVLLVFHVTNVVKGNAANFQFNWIVMFKYHVKVMSVELLIMLMLP